MRPNINQIIRTHVLAQWPLIGLFLVWIIFASPFFFRGNIPFPSRYLVTFFPPWSSTYGMPVKNNAMPDVITQIYPWKKLTIDSWKIGQVPLWNPYSFSGTSHLANYQSAVFSPMNLLFFVMPEHIAWALMILFQPLLAGLLMHVFLSLIISSKTGRFIGSVAFMFCGFMVVWMAYGTLGYAALFLPLQLIGIYKAYFDKRMRYAICLPLGLALSFVSGHFQISLYAALVSLTVLIFEGVYQRQLKRMWFLIILYCCGIAIAAPQILPSLEVFGESVRSTLFTKGEVIPWEYAVTSLAPDYFGNPVTRNDWFGHYAEWASYIGVAPLLLALFSLMYARARRVYLYGGLMLISLLLAYPTIFNDLLYVLKVPVLGTSAASRIIFVASFAGSVLSAFGWEQLSKDLAISQKKVVIFGLAVLCVVGIVWTALLFGSILPIEKAGIAKRNLILPSIFVLITVVGMYGLARWKRRMLPLLAICFSLLVCIDMLRFSTKWMPFEELQFLFPKLPVVSFLEKNVGMNRIYGNFGNEFSGYFGFSGIEGYDAVYNKRYGDFISALASGSLGGQVSRSVVLLPKKGAYIEEGLQLLGVKYIIHKVADGRNVWAYPVWDYPQYQKVYEDPNIEVYENTQAAPRVSLLHEYELSETPNAAFARLFSAEFPRRDKVLLYAEPEIRPESGDATFTIARDTPNELVVRTESSAPKLLLVSNMYTKGWKVSIDQKEARLDNADVILQAVSVPKGVHEVRLYYQPDSFIVGAWIAIAALSAVAYLTYIYDHRTL